METTRNKIRRYLINAALTFVAAVSFAFLGSVITAIDAGTALTAGFAFSLMSGAFIAGLRAVAEYLYELIENRNPRLAAMRKPK